MMGEHVNFSLWRKLDNDSALGSFRLKSRRSRPSPADRSLQNCRSVGRQPGKL